MSKIKGFRLAASDFCYGKSRQNHAPGRSADGAAVGSLRFSATGARRPNSLRSDMGASSAPPACDARRAKRARETQRQEHEQRNGESTGNGDVKSARNRSGTSDTRRADVGTEYIRGPYPT